MEDSQSRNMKLLWIYYNKSRVKTDYVLIIAHYTTQQSCHTLRSCLSVRLYVCPSVCLSLSVRMKQLGSHSTDFH